MNQRVESNRAVKGKLVNALLKLMEARPLSEISVKEIVAEAGVARQSYYRNFHSKRAILTLFYEELQTEIRRAMAAPEELPEGEAQVTEILRVLKAKRRPLLTLHQAGFAPMSLEIITENLEFFYGGMPARSLERYWLTCFAGMVYNTAMAWLENGAEEDCQAMAHVICTFHPETFLTTCGSWEGMEE